MADDISVEYLNIVTQIEARFATTIIVSEIRNNGGTAKEIAFTAELPEAAFISNFSMFINDKIIVGEVKEKEASKIAYDKAKARGESAGHVAQKPRETNMFQISVNVAAFSKAIFKLTYQEMLKRVHGVYKHIVNLIPDRTVDNVQIDVCITEKGEIPILKIPQFLPKIGEKTNKEILRMEVKLFVVFISDEKNVDVKKTIKGNVSNVRVTFKPINSSKVGQFVILYDVERSAESGGQIEVVNGYFVHFIAPTGFKRGNKHVIFVLDKSGSMRGRKMEQLKVAMKTILSDLDPEDKFNIVMFSSNIEKYKSESIPATLDNVKEAREYIHRQNADGGTDLNVALLQSLQMLHSGNNYTTTLTSMLLFMTDGQPTVGETNGDKIVSNSVTANTKNFSIHSLAFGQDADYNLLKRISGKYFGLARKIYEDSDAALQMTGFFDEIRSPLLTEVKIDYLNENIDLSSIVQGDHINHYYEGGEMVVVGKLKDTVPSNAQIKVTLRAKSSSGPVAMESCSACWSGLDCIYNEIVASVFRHCNLPSGMLPNSILPVNTAGGFIERMWAYQTIKKLLKQVEVDDAGQRTTLRQKALELSLKYNFVTELTSMVVIDPVETWRPLFENVLPVPGNSDANYNTRRMPPTYGGLLCPQQSVFMPMPDMASNMQLGFRNVQAMPCMQFCLDDDLYGASNCDMYARSDTKRRKRTIGKGKKGSEKTEESSSRMIEKSKDKAGDDETMKQECHVSAVFVLDTKGDQEKIAYIIRQTIDSLTTMFSKNIQLTLVSVSCDGSGKVAKLYHANNVLLESETLKSSLRQAPDSFNIDLLSALKDALEQCSTGGKRFVAFFIGGAQPLQYAFDVVSNLKKVYPSVQILAITASDTDRPSDKELESLTGSDLNIFIMPQGCDIAQSLHS